MKPRGSFVHETISEKETPLTASEQFEQNRNELVRRLRNSEFLPRNTVNTWLDAISQTTMKRIESIEIFRDIQAEFEWLRPRCRPHRDVLSLSGSREMEYDREMGAIGYQLGIMVKLFRHMERFVERRVWRFEPE